jgi:hypothetical protein
MIGTAMALAVKLKHKKKEFSYYSYSSYTALQSNADCRLPNELVSVRSVFYLPFQFSVLHLLISVCTQFHLVLDGRILGIKVSFNATLLFIDKHRVQKV